MSYLISLGSWDEILMKSSMRKIRVVVLAGMAPKLRGLERLLIFVTWRKWTVKVTTSRGSKALRIRIRSKKDWIGS